MEIALYDAPLLPPDRRKTRLPSTRFHISTMCRAARHSLFDLIREREGIRSSFPSFPRPEEKHATISRGDETPLLSTLFVYSRSTKWRRVKKNCPTYGGHESDIEAAATRVNKMRRERTLTFLLLLLFFLRKKAK